MRRHDPSNRIVLSYRHQREFIHDGDLLLFCRRGLISIAGRGIHSHAGKAAWWGDRLYLLEMRQFKGGRAVPLSSQVAAWPGRWDFFRANARNRWPTYDRRRSTELMKQFAGQPYGWSAVTAAALLHLPIVRLFMHPDVDDKAVDRRPPFCSHACAMADRIGGGVDPVPMLSDRLTEPADLARSPFYEYRCTLTP